MRFTLLRHSVQLTTSRSLIRTGIPTLIGLGNDNVISIYTDNLDAPVKIAGLTITGSGDKHAGVYAEYSKTVVVTNNIITENHHGVELYYDETAQIQANTISDNDYAIIIEFCSYCTVSLNHIVNNSYGIEMSVSNSNEIKQNEIKNTQNGYSITLIRSYVNQITFNNFIDNNKLATFLNCLNYWHDNYWSNKLGILPVASSPRSLPSRAAPAGTTRTASGPGPRATARTRRWRRHCGREARSSRSPT